MELSFFLVLILKISSFHSLGHKPSPCGFESCNYDPAIDDSLNEFMPSEDNSIYYMDGTDTRCTVKPPSTPVPPKSADKALNFAQSAADAAQAANKAQACAAQEASRQVKMKLADEAMYAARTAQVVLAVSLASYNSLVGEIHYEKNLMGQMSASLEASEENANTAEAASKGVEQQTASMQDELEETRTCLDQLDALFEQASAEMKEKKRLLATIKERMEHLSQQMEQANSEYNQAKDEADDQAKSAAKKDKKKAPKKCLPVGRQRKVIPRSPGECFKREILT